MILVKGSNQVQVENYANINTKGSEIYTTARTPRQ
jgi:hypothetical protein